MTYQEYLDSHSITPETAEKFGLREMTDAKYGAQIAIPVKDSEGSILFYKYRNLDRDKDKQIPKFTFDTGSHETTFNQEIIASNPTIVIFEGEIDAIRASQAGIPAISGTNGAASIPDDWVELLKGKDIYLCYDNDEPGRKAIYKLSELFPKAKIISLPEGIKDASEFLTNNSKQEFIELIKQAVSMQEWAVSHPKEEYSTLSLSELLAMDFPEEKWIVEKFLPSEGFVFISGESGTGKSWLALSLARAAVTGEEFLGKFNVGTQCPTLIIDKENGLKRLKIRMEGLKFTNADQLHILKYPEKFSLENDEFMQALQDFIQVNKVKLVVLDSFIDVFVGNENSSTDVSTVLNALRSISTEVCWLILHHEAKPVPRFNKTAGQRMRGSGNILAQIDYQFATTMLSDGKTVHIEQGKNRDNEKMKKFAIEFESDEQGAMTGFKYLGDISDKATKVDEAKDLIVATLQAQVGYLMPQKELLDAVTGEISERTIKDALKVLELEGAIKKESMPGTRNQKAVKLTAFTDDYSETNSGEQIDFIGSLDRENSEVS